jgi:hypothetical protein
MSEQSENELICVALLGWEMLPGISTLGEKRWNDKTMLGHVWPATPTFTSWAEAGLILDALQSRLSDETAAAELHEMGRYLQKARLREKDVRAAALAYLAAT